LKKKIVNKSFVNFLSVLFFLFSLSYASNQLGISYQLKYADGEGNSRNFFENYFDLNYFFDNGIYLFSQLEYSSPPLVGNENKNMSDAINIFYLQYSTDKYDITLGNLYLLYGRGLSMHTYEDQGIDYDNSLIGVESVFHIQNKWDLSIALGSNIFKSRINPADIEPSLSIKNDLLSINSELYFDNLNFHYLGMVYNQQYDYEDILQMMNLSSDLGDYLYSRREYIIDSGENPSDEMKNVEHNIGMDFNLGRFDFYFEKSIIYYDKLLSGREEGFRDYISTYFNLNDFNIFYEYKNYHTPYFYSLFSNPPICFRESSSVLLSRNLHSIDFNNEYGHQLEINRTFENSLNFIFSYAFAFRYNENLAEPSLFETSKYLFDDDDLYVSYSEFYPFKQTYFELNGWSLNDMLFYKIGYDTYYEVTNLKTIKAITIPMQFAYNFKKGNSVTFYLEFQEKVEERSNSSHEYAYFSPSYNHFGKWLFTLFIDKEDTKSPWSGIDFTYNINNSSQLSLFYGSQKGGLVCANGSCVIQPDFEDGFKVSYLISI